MFLKHAFDFLVFVKKCSEPVGKGLEVVLTSRMAQALTVQLLFVIFVTDRSKLGQGST